MIGHSRFHRRGYSQGLVDSQKQKADFRNHMTRHLAAFVLMEPALNANYLA